MKQKIWFIFAAIMSQVIHAPIDQRSQPQRRPLAFENLKYGEMHLILNNSSSLVQSFFVGTFSGIQ